MGNRADSLIVSQARHETAINNLEDTSFGLCGGVATLIKNAPHITVALRRSVTVIHACALFVTGAGAHPRGETFRERKGRCGRRSRRYMGLKSVHAPSASDNCSGVARNF